MLCCYPLLNAGRLYHFADPWLTTGCLYHVADAQLPTGRQ
jgi:hypothetical protein